MKNKTNRFLEKKIVKDLKKKMVFIGGPRQVGKTTLSRFLIGSTYFKSLEYYNWDSKKDRQTILNEKWGESDLIIFDEIHKYPKWKPLIKGAFDKRKPNQTFLITGSARLDIFRKGGDSLQGRYHYYRLHPFSLSELQEHTPKLTPFKPLPFSGKSDKKNIDNLLKFGGFPEPFLAQSEHELRRWHKEKLERLFREDVRDLSRINDLGTMERLADLLPEKVASLLSINSLQEDLEVSHKTINNWLKTLESLYYCYRVYPYQSNRIRALKKEPKLYLWDWSEIKKPGAKIENFIASHLLKTVHYMSDYEGYKCELCYLRDKEKREVDFLVTIDNKPWFCVEVKTTDSHIPTPLKYFKEKLNIPYTYVVTLGEEEYTKNGIKVLPAEKFLTGLV